MFTLEKKYRDLREEVKKSCLLKYENDKDRLCNTPPPRVSPIDWAPLIASYNPDEYKEMMLAPPIKLNVIPGSARVEEDDDIGVEQDIIQVHAEAEPMEQEAVSEDRSSCTSVNDEEIIETAEDPHAEELTRMERELRQQVEDMRALRAQNVHLLQKIEEIESKCDSLAAPTQRLVPGPTPASADTDENTPQVRMRSKKRSKRDKSNHEETVVREHNNGGASGSKGRTK